MFITLNYHISATFNNTSKINFRNLAKSFVKKIFYIRLVFNSFKIKNYFAYKDSIPNDLKSFLVYKFTCASCSYSYIGKTCRHFKTRIEKHIKKVNKSHIFKHIHSTATCFDSYNSHCFKIIDMVNSKFDLKMKEVVHINWRKPNLNVQQNHFALTHSPIASVPLVIFCLCLLVCLFLHFSFVCYFHYL